MCVLIFAGAEVAPTKHLAGTEMQREILGYVRSCTCTNNQMLSRPQVVDFERSWCFCSLFCQMKHFACREGKTSWVFVTYSKALGSLLEAGELEYIYLFAAVSNFALLPRIEYMVG